MGISVKRAAIVTGALAVTGFVCGAALGTIVLTGMVVRDFGIPGLGSRLPAIALAGVGYGGALGAMLTPPMSWLLLRRVSLGRALLETAAGILIGATIALVAAPLYTIQAALGGFLLAALRLRIKRSSSRARQIDAGDESAQLSP
jgi:hypothetical protein